MNMKPTLTLLTALLLAPLATLHAAAPRPNIIISRITVRAGCFDTKGGTLEIRRGSPTGPVLASVEVKPSGQADSGEFLSIPATLTNASGLIDVCVVARCADKNTELGLNWIEFQP
jgi:hypothetical protein